MFRILAGGHCSLASGTSSGRGIAGWLANDDECGIVGVHLPRIRWRQLGDHAGIGSQMIRIQRCDHGFLVALARAVAFKITFPFAVLRPVVINC